MNDTIDRQAIEAILNDLNVESDRCVEISHKYTALNDKLSAEKVAHKVDGLRTAINKLEGLLRE